MSKKIEKATNLIATLKDDLLNLQDKGIDKTLIVSLEKSVKEIIKLENEIITLTEKLEAKISLKKQKKEELSVVVKSTASLLKVKEPAKKKVKSTKKSVKSTAE